MQEWIEDGWRLLFWIGGLKAAFGLLLRMREEREFQARPKWGLIQALKEHRKALVSIGIASGFSFATYTLAFTLMNGYVPLVTSLAKADVMKVNTALLAIDMFLLPCFGFLAHKFGKEKIMLIGALCSSASALPLFYYLDGASLAMVTAIRFVIVFFGVAFAAPYHAWKLELVPPEHRSTIVSLGCTLGSRLIGAPTSVICLWMYQQSGYVWAPGIYLMIIGLLAGIVIYRQKATETISQTPLP
jgi:MFS family permease